ncbi:MAG: DUF2092 domain-containing protein [Pseudomonadota bacterium]
MLRSFVPVLLASLLSYSTSAAVAQDNEAEIEQSAADLAMETANFLASQDDMAFNWFVSFDEVVDENEKVTFFRSGTIVLDRGTGFVAQTERGDTYRDFYFDGSVFSIVSPNENFYASTEIEGTFDTLAKSVQDRSDTILPLWSMLSADLPDTLLENVHSGAYLGTTLISGQHVHHLAFAQDDFDWQIWISVEEDTPLPLMLIGTDRQKPGWPQYRVYFSEWNLDPEIADGQFTYQPEDDDVKMSFPTMPASTAPATAGSD